MEWRAHLEVSPNKGDPTRGSSFAIYFCGVLERPTHLIEDVVSLNIWSPVQVERDGPQIASLFFADNSMVFAEANCGSEIVNAA